MRTKLASLLLLFWAGPVLALSAYLPDGVNSVNVVDTATQSLIAKIPVGDGPQDVAVTPDGRQVFVVNNRSNSVSVIDTISNVVVSNIPLSGFLNTSNTSRIAITPDGKFCFVLTLFGFVALDVTNAVTNTSAAFVSSHTLFGFPQLFEADMAPDGQRLYIPTGIGALQYLLPRPPFNNTLMFFPDDPNANPTADNVAVSTDSKTIFVTNFDNVKQVNVWVTSATLVNLNSFGFADAFQSTFGTIALSPKGDRLFITRLGDFIEWLPLPLSRSQAQPIQIKCAICGFTSNGRWGFTPDGSLLFVGGRSFLTVPSGTILPPQQNTTPIPPGVAAVVQPVTPTPGPAPSNAGNPATTVSGTKVTLSWTAPSNGILVGGTSAAVSYEIRFATYSLFIGGTFETATPVASPPKPLAMGTPQTFSLRGLPPNQKVNFLMKSFGEINPNTGFPDFSATVFPAVTAPASFPAGNIFTYAGTGVGTFSGDGGASTAAALNLPFGVDADNNGNIYIADTQNCRVRKVDVNGVITTFAGNPFGNCFFLGGDGGPATNAVLGAPKDVAADGLGNVFIADTFNNAIRKVDTTGKITTVASGISQPLGISVDAQGNNIYFADGSRLVKLSMTGVQTVLAVGGGGPSVNPIVDSAVDAAGNVYFADANKNQIFKIPPSGQILLVAGTSARSYGGDGGPPLSAAFSAPQGVAVRGNNLFISDAGNNRIREVSFDTNITTTIAGNGVAGFSGDGGPALQARFNAVLHIAADVGGNVYLADLLNNRIRAVGAPAPAIIAPAAVMDLKAVGASTASIALSWTSPGNDGTSGTLFGSYDIGYATTPIAEPPSPPASVSFTDPSVTHVPIATTTAPGQPQSALVSGLSGGTTFFFALKTTNSLNNTSPLSNVASAQTFSVSTSTDGVVSLVSPVAGVTLTIVSSPTASSVALQQGLTPITSIYDLSPSGLSFSPPAKLTFTYPVGTMTSTLAIYKFNGTTWSSATVTGQVINVAARTIAGDTATSSLYALFTRDTLPPRTVLNIGQPQFGGTPVFITSSTLLSFAAVDDFAVVGDSAGVGVAQTLFSIDGSVFAPFVSSFSIPGEGLHAIRFFSADKVGNTEAVHTSTVAVDNTPPFTSVAVSTPAFFAVDGSTFVTSSSQIAFTAVDSLSAGVAVGVASTQFRIDAGAFALSTAPFTLSEGSHTVDFQSRDLLGNLEALKSLTLKTDNTPPTTRLVIKGTQTVVGTTLFISTDATFSFSAQDPVVNGVAAGVRQTLLSLDGGPFNVFVGSFSLAVGTHTLAFQSQDNVGNLESVKTSSFTVSPLDILPPRTTLTVGAPQFPGGPLGSTFVTNHTSFTLSSMDDRLTVGDAVGLGVAFSRLAVDSLTISTFTNPVPQVGQAFSSSFTLASSPDGLHFLGFFAQDILDNREAVHVATVAVDNTPPVTTVVLSTPSFNSFISTATFLSLSAADPLVNGVASGVKFTFIALGTAPFTAYAGPIRFTPPDGSRSLSFFSQDNLLNTELARSATVFLDATPPASSLSIGAPTATLADGSILVGGHTPFLVVSTDPAVNGVSSGVKESFVAVGTGPFSLASGAFTLSPPDGPQTIRFFSVDNVLNTEAPKSTTVVLDTTPPIAALLSPTSSAGGVCMVFNGKFPVIGTVADLHFQGYVLDFAPGANASLGFTLIAASTVVVSSGTLAVWDTSGLSGFQTLRLTATDLVDNVTVTTATVFVGSPALLLSLQGRHGFNKPSGVGVDAGNRIYVADTNNDQVDVFTSTGGFVTILGRGHGQDGDKDDRTQGRLRLNKPKNVKVDAAGNVFIADTNNNRVIKVSLSGQLLLQIGRQRSKERKDHDDDQDGQEMTEPGHGNGQFNKPSGVALDASGRIFVSDTNNHRVQIFAPDGSFVSSFGLPTVVPPAQPEPNDADDPNDPDGTALGQPYGIALDAAGNIYVADAHGDRILKFSPQGILLRSLGSPGSGPGQFLRPEGVAVDPDGGCLYASDRNNDRVQRFDSAGNVTLIFGSTATFNEPVGLALDNAGDLFIADRNDNRVLKYGAPAAVPQAPVIVNVSSFIQGLVHARGGGRLDRGDRVSVIIPDGALNQDMPISIQPDPSDPATLMLKNQKAQQKGMVAISSSVDYGPEGTTFNKPVTITLAYAPDDLKSGVDPGSLAVFYWNPQTADWEALPSVVNQASMTVSAQTSHFSLYGILGAAAKPQAAPSNTVATIQVACNPMRPAIGCEPMRFQGLPAGASLRIYTFTGALVKSLSADGSGTAAWDGTNQSGAPAASGVYFVYAQGAGATKTIKVAVQR